MRTFMCRDRDIRCSLSQWADVCMDMCTDICTDMCADMCVACSLEMCPTAVGATATYPCATCS